MRVKSEEEIILEVCKGNDYKTILEKGTPQQQYKLADCLSKAIVYEKITKLVIKLYKKAADAGHVEASFSLFSHIRDKGKSALKYLKFAAEKGHMGAKLALARCYVFRNYSTFFKTSEAHKGFEIVKELSDKKVKDAYDILAACYETGTGTEMDLEKAKKYYKLSYPGVYYHVERIDMLIREKEKPNKKTREMIAKNYPYHYKIEDGKLVAL